MEIISFAQSVGSYLLGLYFQIGDAVLQFFFSYSRQILDVMHVIFDSAFLIVLYFTALLTISYTIMSLVLLAKKRTQPVYKLPDEKEFPTVTIQIPTYNELAAINCAECCLAFDYPAEKMQIIIGDDSSKPEMSAEIDRFANEHKGRILVTRRGKNIGYKPGNLNHMLKFTKGEYIVIFDSDFLPPQDFMKRIIAPFFSDKNIAATQARWVTKNFSLNIVSVVGGLIPMLTHHLGLPFLNYVHGNGFIAGSAECIRKKDLLDLGGWKSGCLTEDIEYSLRLTRSGKRICYLEDLHCECEAPFTLRDLCKQQMRWAYGVISALKEHMFPIMKSRSLTFVGKLNTVLILGGYLITLGFFLLTVLGLLSTVTHRPEAIQWAQFLSETGFNMLITSFILTCAFTLVLGNKTREIPRMTLGSVTVGLLLVPVVSFGISKAIFGRPMQWFMLRKAGNEARLVQE